MLVLRVGVHKRFKRDKKQKSHRRFQQFVRQPKKYPLPVDPCNNFEFPWYIHHLRHACLFIANVVPAAYSILKLFPRSNAYRQVLLFPTSQDLVSSVSNSWLDNDRGHNKKTLLQLRHFSSKKPLRTCSHHSFLMLAESVDWSSPIIVPLNIRMITNIAGISNKDTIIL